MDTQKTSSKKRKVTEETSKDPVDPAMDLEVVPTEGSKTAEEEAADKDKQLALIAATTSASKSVMNKKVLTGHIPAFVPPGIVTKLIQAKVIGHVRPISERIMDARFYEVNVTHLRSIMTGLLKSALNKRYHEIGIVIKAQATAEIAKVVPLTVDACMLALYAKMRTIHKQYGTYSGRYTTPASYNKDIELPLPFADAISDFGVFESTCADKCYVYVPVFPEGTKHEGRSEEEWHSYKYESCIQILRDLKIPLRSVDTRHKTGSPWWTYKIAWESNFYQATMIVPPLHYSNNSATIASMFLGYNSATKSVMPIIKHKDDDEDYGFKFFDVRAGTQVRAFFALCALPDEDWNACAAT